MASKKLTQKEFDLVSNLIFEQLSKEIREKRLADIEAVEVPLAILNDIERYFEISEVIVDLNKDKTALQEKLVKAIKQTSYNASISLNNAEKLIQSFKEAMVKTTYPDLREIKLQLLLGDIENLDETITKITQVMKEKLNLI